MNCASFVFNITGKQTSQLKGPVFETMAEVSNSTFLANKNGLFILSGSLDNGAVISSKVRLAKTDFGIQNEKRLYALYIWMQISKPLTIEVQSDEETHKVNVSSEDVSKVVRYRIRLPRTLKGRYFSISFSSPSGVFVLDSVDAEVTVLHSGHA